MSFLQSIFKFYIDASIHVALSVVAFINITGIYFDLPCNQTVLYFAFFGTITAYNFVKYAGIAKLHHRSLTAHLRHIQVFSFLCFVIFLFFFIGLESLSLLVIMPFALLTLLYAVPFLSGFQKNLRSISYLKIFIVAAVWTGITVLLPMYSANRSLDSFVLLMLLQRFLIVFVLILPFDIRDMKFDAISLHTLPQKIGIRNTKKIGFVLLLFCLVLEFMITQQMNFRRVFFIVFLVFSILLMRSETEQSKYYSSFWVEAIPIFWYIALLVF